MTTAALADAIARDAVAVARLDLAGSTFVTHWESEATTSWRLRRRTHVAMFDVAVAAAIEMIEARQ